MPIRQGAILASRVSTWPRDHFCRSTIAPRSSRPTAWNVFLPISIPITAITLASFSTMTCSFRLRLLPALLPAYSLTGLEHGRTIPLPEVPADGLLVAAPIESPRCVLSRQFSHLRGTAMADDEIGKPRPLRDSAVLITGGTSGVGLAAALRFAAAGVKRIALVGRS